MKPQRLKAGDKIRIIAPSRSMAILGWGTIDVATRRLNELGFDVTFGKNTMEIDEWASSSIEARVDDLHEAFADKSVRGIFTAIGGFNSNQLLRHIDYSLIANNPKILCGYSDITALSTAIHAKTGLVTYSGPHFSSFGMQAGLEYTIESFRRCLMADSEFEIIPAEHWSNDAWWMDQEKRDFIPNQGHRIIQHGSAERVQGTVLGGNLSCLAALFGTEYMPAIRQDTVLFLEECVEQTVPFIDRLLQSVCHQPDFKNVKALMIGRFEKSSNVSNEQLDRLIQSKQELKDMLVVADLDFGHTTPCFTFPIGGECAIEQIPQLKISVR